MLAISQVYDTMGVDEAMLRKKVETTHLADNLELLALAELGLGNGLLNALDGLVVELL